MKTKYLIISLIMLVSCQTVFAQSMTDEQVRNYAIQRKGAGADSKTISAELISQGATVEQLRRVSTNMKKGTGTVSNAGINGDVERSRVNNGEVMPDFSNLETEKINSKIFGHDIFRSKLLSFEPNMSIAVASNYVLGPGDELIIDVYGSSSSTNKLKVAPDGSVTIPKIGPVNVSGMTVEQAQSRIHGAMGSHYSNASIKVSVGQTRTISISVMGEVVTPGTYTLSAFSTVFHALYMAGGINDMGTLRDIKVARNGRVISTVDVYEYIISGRLAGDVKLNDQDVIIVGSYENLVTVDGKVKRPMVYEMKKDESIKSLIRFCGGFTGDAYSKTVTVNRRAGLKLSLYTVDEFDFSTFQLHDQDTVSVGVNEQRYENMISVTGAVKRPGKYGLTSVKSVRELVEAAGGLQEDAIRNRAVITRMNDDRTRKTISVDLAGILDGTSADIPLKNEDNLTIASLASINDDRKMTISGEVYNPGTFAYAENTTIEDLITMAGGLKESASLLNVEVSRRLIDPSAPKDSIIRTEIFTYELNKDLSIDGQNNFTLKPYDIVSIRRSPVYEVQKTVKVIGEVSFAGDYALKDNKVRLSDVIKRAGGLKMNAFPAGARLMRVMTTDEKIRSNQLLKMEDDASDSIKIDYDDLNDTYNVAINLQEAMDHPGSDCDLILRNGDQLFVPSALTTVKITGEVLYPNNVTYLAGKKAKYYINEAGGYTKKSLRRRAYLIYPNGQVAKLSKGKIQPGCEIVVPTKPEKKNHTDDILKWISLATSLASVSAVMVTAFKK